MEQCSYCIHNSKGVCTNCADMEGLPIEIGRVGGDGCANWEFDYHQNPREEWYD